MIRLLQLHLCVLLLCPAVSAQDEELFDHVDRTDDGVAYLEWEATPARPMVGQEVTLRVRFGVSQEFFAEHLVQPFRQPLDLPVALRFGALEDLAALEWLGAWSGGARSFVLGGELAGAQAHDGERAGKAFRGASLTRTLRLTRPGSVTLPAPRLEFASATGFREDLVHGRVALDRRDEVVRGAPLELVVLALPEDDRPPDFNGAVGQFEVWATVPKRTVLLGETIPVVVEIEGAGDLGDALARWPERVAGFQIQARVASGREVRLDLVALGTDVVQLPSLSLAYFDPDRGRYLTALSETVPIEVQPRDTAPVNSGAQGAASAERPPVSGGARTEDAPSGLLPLLGAAAVIVAALVWGRSRRRRPTGFPWSFEAELLLDQRDGATTSEDLLMLLARGLGCPVPGVIGPGLAQRLTSAGLDDAVARRVADQLRAWEETSFGGGQGTTSTEVEDLVERIANP